MPPLLILLWIRAVSVLHKLARDDRGYTSETIIWTAVLSGTALTVGGLWGPEILDAARSVRFK